jgi:hypothetical protein
LNTQDTERRQTKHKDILNHCFYEWKLCELFLLSGFLICHAVYGYDHSNLFWSCYEYLDIIDSIFVSFGGILFQQVVGIPMGTNCAPLLADLLLYSYESEFLQKLVKDKKMHEPRAFNFTYRIDEELQHTDHLFLRVACFTFLNFVWKICGVVA